MKKLFCFIAVAVSLSLLASDHEEYELIEFNDTNPQGEVGYQQAYADGRASNNIQMNYHSAPAQDGCLKRWAFKTVECAFSEDSYNSDPTCCCSLGASSGCLVGACCKIQLVNATNDPSDPSANSVLNCGYSWFPSCHREFKWEAPYLDPASSIPCWMWTSSLCLMGGCALTTCLLLKKYRDESRAGGAQYS